MNPEMRYNFLICLKYTHLEWLFFSNYKSIEEKTKESEAKIEEWRQRGSNGPIYKFIFRRKYRAVGRWVSNTWLAKKMDEPNKKERVWIWLLKRVRNDKPEGTSISNWIDGQKEVEVDLEAIKKKQGERPTVRRIKKINPLLAGNKESKNLAEMTFSPDYDQKMQQHSIEMQNIVDEPQFIGNINRRNSGVPVD